MRLEASVVVPQVHLVFCLAFSLHPDAQGSTSSMRSEVVALADARRTPASQGPVPPLTCIVCATTPALQLLASLYCVTLTRLPKSDIFVYILLYCSGQVFGARINGRLKHPMNSTK